MSMRIACSVLFAVIGGAWVSVVHAGAPEPARVGTVCGQAGGADVIVGDLQEIGNYTSVGGVDAFSVGTTSCNVGDTDLQWVANTNEHPVIAQNMYRLKNGRFEQVGMSWLKHGFNALTEDVCGCGCNGHGGTVLGVGCSDPYDAFTNAYQRFLGPHFEVNPYTGVFAYPFTGQNQTGDATYKRLQVKVADLDPSQNGGGQYFVEGHYVTQDDAAAGNQANNASYRPITLSQSGGEWSAALAGVTAREDPAIRAWTAYDPAVEQADVYLPSDGLVIVAGRATPRGVNRWHYEYAVQNLFADGAIGAFRVPVGIGADVSSIGFHDVDYHDGEPYAGTDWAGAFDGQYVTWATTPYAVDPDANALRWGTLYNFRFDADVPPASSAVELGIFKPAAPDHVSAAIVGPSAGVLCATAFGDGDSDCDADLADYARLQWCFSGTGQPYAPGCACFDADTDLDIDLTDVAELGDTWTGPAAPISGCSTP